MNVVNTSSGVRLITAKQILGMRFTEALKDDSTQRILQGQKVVVLDTEDVAYLIKLGVAWLEEASADHAYDHLVNDVRYLAATQLEALKEQGIRLARVPFWPTYKLVLERIEG